MREQTIGQRVGNRSGISPKNRSASIPQRPARRGRAGSAETVGGRRRSLLRYVPFVLKLGAVIVTGLLLFAGYKAAASARIFQLHVVEVRGTSRASMDAVQSVVRHDVAGNGVWRADLKEISSHLERLAWVRSAVVTRVLPDGIRVRITERVPCTVVRLASGHFIWVDEDAVLLGEMKPTDDMPPFFLRGWNEDDSETARTENRERIRKYLELRRLWDGNGLSERVSEVNLGDVRDVRAQLSEDDSQIEVRLGSQDLGNRLKKALEVLDEQRQTPRGPFISYVDLTQGKRAIVGFVSGGRSVSDGVTTFPSTDSATEKERPRNKQEKRAKTEKQEGLKQKRTR